MSKREPRIYLDKEHGVAPMLCVCNICGEDTGAIALLGRNINRLKDGEGNQYRYKGSSTEKIAEGICDRCQKLLDDGATCFINNDTKDVVVITKERSREMLGDKYHESRIWKMYDDEFKLVFSGAMDDNSEITSHD
jgi:hypothetical protein